MTTILRTRNPLETLSMSQQASGRRRSKRLAAYDEKDGDFVFMRGSKRRKTSVEPSDAAPTSSNPAPKRTKSKHITERDEESNVNKSAQARNTSFTPSKREDNPTVAKRGTRRSTRRSTENREVADHTSKIDLIDDDSMDLVGVNDRRKPDSSAVDTATVIPLPFSDTPVINRNKELRKKGAAGARRSSLGMRGRRASSLIENGHSAIPHREVDAADFYKHIEAEGLPEPRRMKQLLTWTGERALGEKQAAHGDPDSGLILAARAIQESLLKDFGNKSEFSDWFSREDSAPTKVIKKPNPRNVEIQASIADIEPRIRRLQKDRDEWKTLVRSHQPIPPLFPDDTTKHLEASSIDSSLLDPEQAAILAALQSHSSCDMRQQIADQLKDICSDLEPKVDEFADGIHKMEQFQGVASRVANKILALSAVRLEDREREEKEAVGTRDVPMQEVLRSLSRILPEGGNGAGN